MPTSPSLVRRLTPSLLALGILGVLFYLSQFPSLSKEALDALASRFAFEKLPFPEIDHAPYQSVRNVHPSLHHLRSWISFVGAGVSLADLDGDGLPNDMIFVDPRLDQVIVAPVPGTRDRYTPFYLSPEPLSFDRSTMAPMGCRVGDFNEDGYPDILVYYWGRSPILFLQKPNPEEHGPVQLSADQFVRQELVEPYQVWYTNAVSLADLDGDGHVDLILGNYNADGSHVLDTTGTGTEEMMHTMSGALNGGPNRMFLWDSSTQGAKPSARFRESEGAMDPEVAHGWTFAVGAADLDGDMLPEVYFAKDFGPDRLLHNRSERGKLRFTPLVGRRGFTTPRSLVVGQDTFNGMGVDFGDLNGDGLLDIFVSNITSDFGLHESNFVFLSTGQTDLMRQGIAPYVDGSEDLGLSRAGWTWDVKLGDFDNDGVLEAVQAAGYMKGTINRWPELHELALGNGELMKYPLFYHRFEPGTDASGQSPNRFFVRAADGRYYDVAKQLGLGEAMLSRGIATADVDGDGRLDMAIANNWEASFFYHNTAPNPGAFLGLHVRLPIDAAPGPTVVHPGHPLRWVDGPSRPAIGAAATVHLPDGRRLAAQVDGGNGHTGQRAPDLHFGLGTIDLSVPVKVDLRWRDQTGEIRSETFSLKPNNWHTLNLGKPAKE